MDDNANNVHLELYKILNERVQKEIEEMYDVHRIHFLAVTALITISGFWYENPWLSLICGLAGVWICIVWWKAADSQERWKLWWTTELAKIETKLPDVCIWRKLIFNEQMNNLALMAELKKPERVDDPPPFMKSVDVLLRFRPVIFGAICLIAVSYGAFNLGAFNLIVQWGFW